MDVREYQAGALTVGEIAEMLSPSLFGGRRLLILRSGQDARKDLVAALLAYAKNPDPDVQLLVLHLGGAKGKAFADGLRAAGATVVPAAKLKGHRDRVAFVRDEFRRAGGSAPTTRPRRCIAAVGNDLRELAAACSQLIADTDGRIGAETVSRYYRGRVEVTGFTVADATMVGDVPAALEALRWALHVGVDPVPIADALADGVRTVARVASAGRGNPYQLASTSACRPGRSSGRSGRGAVGRPRAWSRPCRSPPSATRPSRAAPTTGRTPWSVRSSRSPRPGRAAPVTGANRPAWATIPVDEERYRPLYARLLGLRFVNPAACSASSSSRAPSPWPRCSPSPSWSPGGRCWSCPHGGRDGQLNDMVAATRSVLPPSVPEQERYRFRQQMEPVVGRARVEWVSHSVPGVVITADPVPPPRPADPSD